MARRFVFPDPDDRSKNNPSIILDNAQVLNIYNQDNEDGDDMQRVTKKVQDWILAEATNQGWDEAHFIGNQCILTKSFK